MAAGERISLNDETLQQCQLERCQLRMLKNSLGLCLQWQNVTTDDEDVKIHNTVLTDSKTNGKLYPTNLNNTFVYSIFGRGKESLGSSEGHPRHALVMCGNGMVAAVSSAKPGVVRNLCHLAEPLVWCGFLKCTDNESGVVVVVTRSGVINMAKVNTKPGYKNLQWFTESLDCTALDCGGYETGLIVCDGALSFSCFLTCNTGGAPTLRIRKLKYFGVYRIVEKSKKEVELLTCDGRKYVLSWESLLSRTGEKKEKDANVKDTVSGIKRHLEKIHSEGKQIELVDLYIKQLNIVQSLVNCSKDIFTAIVRVDHQRMSYNALIELIKTKPSFDFVGSWWKLCITIPSRPGYHYLTVRLDDHSFQPKYTISIPLHILGLDIKENLKPLELECHLVLDHFETGRPFCRIPACIIKVDILHFLGSQYILNHHNPSMKFRDKLVAVRKQRNCNKIGDKHTNKQSYKNLLKMSASFIADDKTANVMKHIFTPFENLLKLEPEQFRLWYHEYFLDIQTSQCEGKILVTIEGTKLPVVLAATLAIADRMLHSRLTCGKLSLPSNVLQRTRQSQRILEFESSKATTPEAVSHLYHIITHLISLIPL